MADFDPPFANAGDRRFPTSDEQAQGFECGPLDLDLFNGMFFRLESEIGNVISSAGLSQSNGDFTQLRQAISALIAAAVGSGDTANFLTVAQARARLPIFPDVQTANGQFGITTPATGQIRIPAGVTFMHRGVFPVTTAETDIATSPSKTYHLRWSPTGGFVLKDLSAGAYNPSALPESNPIFDSTYDDMLIARIITNSSNVPTITNLANKDRLADAYRATGNPSLVTSDNGWQYSYTRILNWARTPTIFSLDGAITSETINATGYLQGTAGYTMKDPLTRYQAGGATAIDWNSGATTGTKSAYLDFNLVA